MKLDYFQSQIKVAAMMRKGVRPSRICLKVSECEDNFLASKLYFLYMIIKILIINIYKYLPLGKGCQELGNGHN